jgi:hypothetical protein
MSRARDVTAHAGRIVRAPAARLSFAVALIVVAVLAVLLAQDVRSWRDTLNADAIRYSVSAKAQEQWTPSTNLPAGLSERLLGVARDRHWLSALRFYSLANAVDPRALYIPVNKLLLQTAEKSLAEVAQDPNPVLASRAYTLLGAILFKDSQGGFSPDTATTLASIAAMQNAVRVAGGYNEQANADLELLLRQYEADLSPSDLQQANNQGARNRGKAVARGKGIPPLATRGGDY